MEYLINKKLTEAIINAIDAGIQNALNELSNETVWAAANKVSDKAINFKKWLSKQNDAYKNRIRKMSQEELTYYLTRQLHIIISSANSINAIVNILHKFNLPVSPEFYNYGDVENSQKTNLHKKTLYSKRKPTEYEHQIYLAINNYDKCTLPNKKEIKDKIDNEFIEFMININNKYNNNENI